MNVPDQQVNPPGPTSTTKSVTVYIRFAGVHEVQMDVPDTLDLRDSEAVADYLDEWTMEHRPSYAAAPPDMYRLSQLTVADFWRESKPSATGWGFRDPGRGRDEARVFIEGVEED